MNPSKVLGASIAAWMALTAGAAEPVTTAANTYATQKMAHKVAHKPSPKATHHAKAAVEAASATAALEPITDERLLALSQQVHTGQIACELGAHVMVTPDSARTGGFVVQLGKQVFHMSPVVSSTGAIRLEDAKDGAMWLQLGNKSMLMNTKLGQRMADECQSPTQQAVAESLKNNPPPSLLDEPSVARK